MADKYENYSKDDLIRLLRERDRKPKFGLVWERDEIDHDKSVNGDFIALDLQEDLSCGDAPFTNLLIEGDNFDALRYPTVKVRGYISLLERGKRNPAFLTLMNIAKNLKCRVSEITKGI